MPQIQITGGAFQDYEANRLANGYLTMALSHDEQEPTDPGQIVAGLVLKVPLDGNGNVSGTVNIWPNDVLSPASSYYIVNAYRSDGTQAWKAPQYYPIASTPNPLNLGNVVPTNPPPVASASGLTLQTNSINNNSQTKLNLVNSSSVTFTDNGAGSVSAASPATYYLWKAASPATGGGYAGYVSGGAVPTITNYIGTKANPATETEPPAVGVVNDAAKTYTVTAVSITSNVLTVTCTNTATAGDVINLAGTAESFLNWQPLTVLSSGLNSTQFEANFTYSGAYSNTSEPPAAWAITAGTSSFRTYGAGILPEGSHSGTAPQYYSITLGLLGSLSVRWANYSPVGNVRYWIGLCSGPLLSSSGSSWITNTIGLPADVNGGDFLGFCYRPGLDGTTWHVYIGGYALNTYNVYDTGIAMDTVASHVFAIAPDGAGSLNFLIDGTVVLTKAIPSLYLNPTAFNAAQGASSQTNGSFRFLLFADDYASPFAPMYFTMAWVYWLVNK